MSPNAYFHFKAKNNLFTDEEIYEMFKNAKSCTHIDYVPEGWSTSSVPKVEDVVGYSLCKNYDAVQNKDTMWTLLKKWL